jgi:hypothetical protein
MVKKKKKRNSTEEAETITSRKPCLEKSGRGCHNAQDNQGLAAFLSGIEQISSDPGNSGAEEEFFSPVLRRLLRTYRKTPKLSYCKKRSASQAPRT